MADASLLFLASPYSDFPLNSCLPGFAGIDRVDNARAKLAATRVTTHGETAGILSSRQTSARRTKSKP